MNTNKAKIEATYSRFLVHLHWIIPLLITIYFIVKGFGIAFSLGFFILFGSYNILVATDITLNTKIDSITVIKPLRFWKIKSVFDVKSLSFVELTLVRPKMTAVNSRIVFVTKDKERFVFRFVPGSWEPYLEICNYLKNKGVKVNVYKD